MKKITFLFLLLTMSFGYSQTPGTAAPTPPVRNAVDVISIFSDAYTNISGVNIDPFWGQSTDATEVDIAGDNTLSYVNFNYQGTDWAATPQDISGMEFLHFDIWTNNEAPNVFVISSGAEIPHPISTSAGSWQSIDMPVAGITGDLTNAIQFKFDGGTGGTIYLDNLYFWKNPTAAGSDATLSDLQVETSTISGFSPTVFDYNYDLAPGTTVVPQITAATPTDPAATSVTITQAPSVPGDATVVVVSQNGTVTETYTVSFVIVGPPTAAPTPPARPVADVISLFSDAYSDITIDTWSAVWDDSSYEDVMVDGNATKKITFGNFIGVDFQSSAFDASSFTHFHMDFYTDNPDLVGKVFNSKFSQWGGGSGEVSALELNINTGTTPALATGTWVSIDVEIDTNFVNNLTRDDINQFIITSNLGVVYVDNIYLHKDTLLSTNEFDVVDFNVYPNPSQDVWNVKTNNQTINSIHVYDVLGKQVIELHPELSEVGIDASQLPQGLYFAKIKTNTGINSIKLIKN